MGWTGIRRVLTAGAKNFVRGGAVSVATVLNMTMTLAIIGTLIFLSALLTYTLDVIKDKVDISVYFVTTATEKDILAVKSQLEHLPMVARVVYTSADQALANFRERHANDQTTLQGLNELGFNPLDASLEVKAKDPSQYESIVSFLESSPALSVGGVSIVDKINFAQNKDAIDRLTLAIKATREIGLAIVAIFAISSILIAFATIRLAIYTAKDEIGVMRLVGASNSYIRGPFVVTGIISGAIAALIVLLLLIPATWYAGEKTSAWLGGFNVASYYRVHFIYIASIITASGVVLGAFASMLAIRRYLKI